MNETPDTAQRPAAPVVAPGPLFGIWRPMGSEPKDGTPFLVWLGDGTVLSASWYCQVLCHQYPYATRAKFWMPMPPSPNTATQPRSTNHENTK